jgi:hypothetical protein
MYFEIIGEIQNIEPIAIGTSIRDIARLRKRWYEAHGIGRVKLKIKEFLD